ncbi:hypothetical protein AAFC00_007308 [Neodothiora populina]|uniref:DRMBL-domain-containing protein n=1 Tax=Neodothiora populina TaxID=2781224 RepID=A0ABR3PIZ4_9PEZI
MPARKPSTPRQSALPSAGRGSGNVKKSQSQIGAKNKTPAKPNASILSFFKKTDEDQLFVTDLYGNAKAGIKHSDSSAIDLLDEEEDLSNGGVSLPRQESESENRFNENEVPVKRRKVDSPNTTVENTSIDGAHACTPPPPQDTTTGPSHTKKPSGPFMEDSDSDGEDEPEQVQVDIPKTTPKDTPDATIKPEPKEEVDIQRETLASPRPPQLTREATSASGALTETDQFADFEGIEDDFDDDLYDQGEEFVERRYLEQQRRFEMEEAGIEDESFEQEEITIKTEDTTPVEAASCPICNASLDQVSEQDASTHVNSCLDGNPTPLPEKKPSTPILDGAARFKRPPRPPRPGQESPFELGEGAAGGSAFSKLMSGKAEDAAWAAASAAENASRGKPAYTRTCPFYKILPGFNICVDAFRYGAVKGCNAYFLSHFHSDHYIGLTSSWTHGPIYCSKVTANLVKQQLRVDPQYVVSLDWEVPFEVPGTYGVVVTMISANHCPGSSLYLYEKTLAGHTAHKPKLQRVLHCGDFRACPAHLENPLLMPDIVDRVTGKTRQQKIDVCYLDTTYLNPKYAFPSQTEVIKACADMCVSLNKVTPDESDGWEQMKRARAGKGMVKFVQKDSEPKIKQEEDEDSKEDVKVMQNGKLGSEKSRSRLLVVVGTYSIGKERICLGIARALGSKIYAPPSKTRIVRALEDAELEGLMTPNPREAQVHMTPLFEIRADTLDEYLLDYADSFGRCVGFRPSGWQYRPPNSRFVESPSVQTVLHSSNWASHYSMKELVPQRGSTSRASCFGVPYSEHSSFRELTMFCCALRIEKVIPTVNVGSAKSREKMKTWIERWSMDKKKNGLFKLGQGTEW